MDDMRVELLLNPQLAAAGFGDVVPNGSGGGGGGPASSSASVSNASSPEGAASAAGSSSGGSSGGSPASGGNAGGGDGGDGGGGDGGLPTVNPYAAVNFHFGDATSGRTLDFTHVYAFDRVFSPKTMRALARLLRRSPFRIFASFRSYTEWWKKGLRCIHPVARLRVTTTGKEQMSIHIYANLRFAPR